MTFDEKIKKLIHISIKTIFYLKRKLNTTASMKEYNKIKEYIYINQANVMILSEMVKNSNKIKENYTNKELRDFFNQIKNDIKASQDLK